MRFEQRISLRLVEQADQRVWRHTGSNGNTPEIVWRHPKIQSQNRLRTILELKNVRLAVTSHIHVGFRTLHQRSDREKHRSGFMSQLEEAVCLGIRTYQRGINGGDGSGETNRRHSRCRNRHRVDAPIVQFDLQNPGIPSSKGIRKTERERQNWQKDFNGWVHT